MTAINISTSERIRATIAEAKKADLEWGRNRVGRDDHRFLPWMPFSWPEFVSMVAEAMPEMAGDRFLDVGCGPGTRMLLAQEIFGLDVKGFDRVPEYVSSARLYGLNVTCEDALEYKDYGSFDLIWFNRPIRDRELQFRLEAKIWEEMAPGAVVGCANLESPPPNWYPVLDDWEARRGVWQKP
jgi:trans-aconitate methyltransferase